MQIAERRLQIGITLLLASLAGPVVRAETIDRVLAVVAGQLITLTDVTAAIDLGLQSADGAADPVRAVLSRLIDRELVLAEVDRYAPPEPTAGAVDLRSSASAGGSLRRPPSTRRSRARASTSGTCAKRCGRICAWTRISISASARPAIGARRWSTSGWPACGGAAA